MRRCSSFGCLVVAVVLVGEPLSALGSAASGSAQAGAGGSSQTGGSTSAAAAITPAEAAPFLGDWSVPITSTSGTYVGYITLKVEDNTVVALLSSDVVPEQRTTDVVKAGKGITIRAKMDYEGPLVEKPTSVSVAVTLTPSGDYLSAGMDFKINAKSYFITSTAKRVKRL
jgi:hypothetical protein